MKPTARSRRIQRSYSTSSLDLVQLLHHASLSPSLITESVTFDSLPSQVSLPSVNIPIFPKCRGSSFQLIGLGEHLRMFSSDSVNKSDFLGIRRNQHRTVLTAPTSPRLTKLMKECLSIEKWAEASRGWNAPGHVPWEKVPEPVNFSWTPEGSVYSRETFVKALKFSRSSCVRPTKSGTELPINPDNVPVTVSPIAEVFRPSEKEIREMMSELRCLRSYFQDSLHGESSGGQAERSNRASHSPATLTATKKTSTPQSPTLALRRGKQPPSRLFLSKKQKPKDLSYPGIPTAFLGSPTHHKLSPKPINSDSSNSKSTLNAQDMIQNLRSQCSAMLVQKATLPTVTDTLAVSEEYQLATADGFEPSTTLAEPVKRASKSPASVDAHTHLKSATTKIHRVPPPSIGSDRERGSRRDGVIMKTNSLQVASKSPPRVTSSLPAGAITLPPALPKTVRFEMAPKDIKKGAISSSEDDSQSLTSGHDAMELSLGVVGFHESALRYKGTQGLHSRPLPPASKSRSTVSQPVMYVPWKNDEITPSTVNPIVPVPVKGHLSMLHSSKPAPTREPKITSELSVPRVQHTGSSPNALGRNSLSRIIRGPMFSAPKEIKRETVCMGPKISRYQTVENRPSSEIVGSCAEKRKSRMPGPLRSIFTRFK